MSFFRRLSNRRWFEACPCEDLRLAYLTLSLWANRTA